jgi:hypothetical protein
MTNTLYIITAELHELIQAKAEKFGIEITYLATQSDYLILENGRTPSWNYATDYNSDFKERYGHLKGCFKLEAPQIKHILLAFKEVLGYNPELGKHNGDFNDYVKGWNDSFRCYMPEYQAEALCAKWLDGLTPLFDSKPETVLSELLEVLKAL